MPEKSKLSQGRSRAEAFKSALLFWLGVNGVVLFLIVVDPMAYFNASQNPLTPALTVLLEILIGLGGVLRYRRRVGSVAEKSRLKGS